VSAPSKQTSDLNPKGDLNSIASISVSSTISTPWSEPSASKPRDLSLEREQNSRYRHDNGLMSHLGQTALTGGISTRNSGPEHAAAPHPIAPSPFSSGH